jgi:hypothetical protein
LFLERRTEWGGGVKTLWTRLRLKAIVLDFNLIIVRALDSERLRMKKEEPSRHRGAKDTRDAEMCPYTGVLGFGGSIGM